MMSRTELLLQRLENELHNIPIEHWRFFYPCQVAVWRFIRDTWPEILGDLKSGFDEEPYFVGKGAEWFCDTLGNDPRYLEAIEQIMGTVVDGLPPVAKSRGFVERGELPALPQMQVRSLLSALEAQLGAAK